MKAGKSGEQLFFDLALEDLSIALHKPLGCRGRQPRSGAVDHRLGGRDRSADLRGLREADRVPALPAPLECGRASTAAPHGEHRHQGSESSDILYIKALAVPLTVNTMPEATLKAFADHGEVGSPLRPDGGDCEAVLAQFAEAGIDVNALADELQREGAAAFVKSWTDLMKVLAAKSEVLEKNS